MEPNGIPSELMERFHEYALKISQLLKKNEDFNEIVNDYRYCRQKLTRLSAHSAENKPLIEHYKETILELEEEIQEYLKGD